MSAIRTKKPLVLALNIKRKYFEALGLKHFEGLQKALNQYIENATIFPVVTSENASSIETRAKYIQDNLPEVRPQHLRPYNSF